MILLVTLICSAVIISCTVLAYFVRIMLLRLLVDKVPSRSVFVTGCDTGFGNLLARTLDAKGVRVFAGCFTSSGATALQKETSSRLVTVLIDVTKRESVQAAFETISEHLGDEGLWGLVNNAGIMPSFSAAEWTPIEDYENVCKVNLFGTIDVTLTFLPLLRQSRGRLVNVCSITANMGYPGLANYCMSKAAVKMFTACLRRELLSSGVTAHTIEPGGFHTNITSKERMFEIYRSAYRRASSDAQDFYGGSISTHILDGLSMSEIYLSDKSQMVADSMVHALLAKHPKNRYVVGWDAILFFGSLMLLPERLADWVLGWPKPYGPKSKHLM